ncbi:MAG: hypothetical protein N2036_03970 [Bryobacteraceae bacterium]|nr:hypothetical protein [Bryobacteraceae bacterium]MCX7603212.1 hypothetical protein [Bryobacteraceae bacterium]
MAALPLPKYGLQELYLFPYFQTREQYKAMTGEEPPPFDPTRPAQCWYDPEALKSSRRVIVYENALAIDENGVPKRGPDGKPYFEPLALPKHEAATVNIPYKQRANEPSSGLPDVPVPCRALHDDEELAFDFGGVVVVKNKNFANEEVVGFTRGDRELLRAIAKKLNVNP